MSKRGRTSISKDDVYAYIKNNMNSSELRELKQFINNIAYAKKFGGILEWPDMKAAYDSILTDTDRQVLNSINVTSFYEDQMTNTSMEKEIKFELCNDEKKETVQFYVKVITNPQYPNHHYLYVVDNNNEQQVYYYHCENGEDFNEQLLNDTKERLGINNISNILFLLLCFDLIVDTEELIEVLYYNDNCIINKTEADNKFCDST